MLKKNGDTMHRQFITCSAKCMNECKLLDPKMHVRQFCTMFERLSGSSEPSKLLLSETSINWQEIGLNKRFS